MGDLGSTSGKQEATSAGDPRPATAVTVPTNPGSDPGSQTGSGVALSPEN